jgi:hypothetical protein
LLFYKIRNGLVSPIFFFTYSHRLTLYKIRNACSMSANDNNPSPGADTGECAINGSSYFSF